MVAGLTFDQLMDRMMKSKEKVSCGIWMVAETALGRWFREALRIEEEE